MPIAKKDNETQAVKTQSPKTAKNGKSSPGVNNAAPSKQRRKAKKEAEKEPLPIVYAEPKATIARGEKALTADQAKKLLGWEEETEKVSFGKNFLLKVGERKIRTTKNLHNRDFQFSNAQLVQQEVLRGKWKFNGESCIIGDRGSILSCQHRLIGLILAAEEWKANPDKYPFWTTEPVLETLLVFGISEEDDVVNTIDTGKPRTLADVLFRSIFFSDLPPAERKVIARAAQFGIHTLWSRTGANKNAFSPGLLRTHAESIDFLKRHPRLLEAVKHVTEEDGCAKITGSLGLAAGLLYLMGCSASNVDTYQSGDPPDEKLLNWKHWDKAQNFFVELANGGKKLEAVKESLAKIMEDSAGSQMERTAIVIKAWNLYLKGETPSVADLKLTYRVDPEDLSKTLDDFPTVGGIDLGREEYEPDVEEEPEEEESVLERAKKIRQARNGNGKKPEGPFAKGDKVWVVETDGGNWGGTLTDNIKNGKALVKVGTGYAGAGNVYETEADKLTKTQPHP